MKVRSPSGSGIRMLLALATGLLLSSTIEVATGKELKDLKITKPDNGAIAYHRASGSFGYAIDRRSAREAKVEALNQCNNADCEVVLSLKGGCGAIAAFQKTFFASRGVTRAEAEAKARRQCGPNCVVVVWACTK